MLVLKLELLKKLSFTKRMDALRQLDIDPTDAIILSDLIDADVEPSEFEKAWGIKTQAERLNIFLHTYKCKVRVA